MTRNIPEDNYEAPAANAWFEGLPAESADLISDPAVHVREELVANETQQSLATEVSQASDSSLGDLFADESYSQSVPVQVETSDPLPSTAAERRVISPRAGITITGTRERNAWSGHRSLEDVWPIVETLRNIVSTDPSMQSRVKDLQLTRDPAVNKAQKDGILVQLTNTIAAKGGLPYQPDQMGPALDLLYDEIIGISVLGDLWRDDTVTEIMVDRWDRVVVESNGRLLVTNISFRSEEHANDVARSLALRVSDRAVSQKIPLVTAELPQARVSICYGPIVRGGLSITIRKFRPLLTLDTLLTNGSVNSELVELLRDLVTARATILVSGGTGTGKTTVINLLSNFIPDSERVITIEDSFELQLSNTHVVSLQTKEAASSDDQVSITLADLLRNTLRMRPDRIIVGEIREGEGALTMLSAANTGHDGTMTTVHANSAAMAVNERLPDLIRQSRPTTDDVLKRTIAAAFDVVVQVSRTSRGFRYISEVAVVDPEHIENGQIKPLPLYSGNEIPDGSISFLRTGNIDQSSRLGQKLANSSVLNPGRWA